MNRIKRGFASLTHRTPKLQDNYVLGDELGRWAFLLRFLYDWHCIFLWFNGETGLLLRNSTPSFPMIAPCHIAPSFSTLFPHHYTTTYKMVISIFHSTVGARWDTVMIWLDWYLHLRGSFSVVRKAVHKKTKTDFAVKVISKKNVNKKELEMLDTEVWPGGGGGIPISLISVMVWMASATPLFFSHFYILFDMVYILYLMYNNIRIHNYILYIHILIWYIDMICYMNPWFVKCLGV